MSDIRQISLNLAIVSATVLCFEIVATRISSVIFVNNFAFMILSLAILGLGVGGIYAHYRMSSEQDEQKRLRNLPKILGLLGASMFAYLLLVTQASFVTNLVIYFLFLFFPFFFAGIFYACVFESYAGESFQVYAADLAGAALGSIAAIAVISSLGPTAGILFLMIMVLTAALSYLVSNVRKAVWSVGFVVLLSGAVLLVVNGNSSLLGRVQIGNFEEKDIHHVYPNLNVEPQIIDSRWSIYGRSDLVSFPHQNRVRYLFVDGAAGSQMYRFNGNPDRPDRVLSQILSRSTNFVPLRFLDREQKNSMLVIGPGGGKEVLGGLIMDVDEITGVEINPDFVEIVKDQARFNGGIYTDFPNVDVRVEEGRQFVKKKQKRYDLIVMALPSTQQLQNIDSFALSENYLLTVEAIHDYLDNLSREGRMIFTVHNRGEMKRLITTAIRAFEERGIGQKAALNHFAVLEQSYSPTLVIKKEDYTKSEVAERVRQMREVRRQVPQFTYLPYRWSNLQNTIINGYLADIYRGNASIERLVERDQFDISASYDDSPYFYKIKKGIPDQFMHLFFGVLGIILLLVAIPAYRIRRQNRAEFKGIVRPLALFLCIGAGFMVLEVALFQKLVLYLGSPTISLSILLSSLLVGMGVGSYTARNILPELHDHRLFLSAAAIVVSGIAVILLYPWLLGKMLVYDQAYRGIATFLLLVPFGFLLGIPFPTCIQLLKGEQLQQYVPWMYGVNGAMSILGSILAVIFSMWMGFTAAFFIGLGFYAMIILLQWPRVGLTGSRS